MRPIALLLLFFVTSGLRAEEAPPRSLDPRLKITLFAENPQLVTPTGIDVDDRGRVWAIESNTHFPPKEYKGHPSDRLLVLSDSDGDGRADKEAVFLDGLKHTMSVAVRPTWLAPIVIDPGMKPADRQVFVATRREILLLEDTDGDDKCDRQTRLVWLETKGDYPHNGLAGFAFDPLGGLFFGFGENLGEAYAIHTRGAPDKPMKGGGEGGNIYRMRPDGTEMTFWATGFWNPHASCVDAFGRLFTVDNDPDSRPPCRLLHVIRGGDYGYRFRNGRKGLHPFTAWNGEIPGTLPMVAGTGEAPSGVLAYEHDAFPAEYLGNLIVTSWGDHRLDRFRLKPKGASVESVAEPFVVGGENFRPVGIALAPDGSLYCTDWVKRDYQLHGHGRVWRVGVSATPPDAATRPEPNTLAQRRREARSLAETLNGRNTLVGRVLSQELDIRHRLEALWAIASSEKGASDPPFARRAEVITEIAMHFAKDKVFWELVSLADRPQVGFPDDEKSRPEPIHRAYATGQNALFTQLRALIQGGPQWLSQKTADSWAVRSDYAVGMWVEDPFVATTAIDVLHRTGYDLPTVPYAARSLAERDQVNRGLLARRRNPHDVVALKRLLNDPSPRARQLAVQWAAEENLAELRPEVEGVLAAEPMTADLFLATLASLEMLEGRSPLDFDKTPPGKYVVPLLKNPKSSDAVRTQALKLFSPAAGELLAADLAEWATSKNEPFALEAVRTLGQLPDAKAESSLLAIIDDKQRPRNVRLEAIALLAGAAAKSEAARKALTAALAVAKEDDERIELLRSLRGVKTPEGASAIDSWLKEADAVSGPVKDQARFAICASRGETAGDLPTAAAWLKEASKDTPLPPGDIAQGRRLFFHPEGPGCFKCHVVEGRGGAVGPNLSRIGGSMIRLKLIESILEPSKEVSPQFTSWTLISTSGQVLTGMIVHENEGTTVLGDSTGKTTTVKTADVEERVPQKVSVMPEKLAERMTPDEFFDLVSFLESLR